MVGQYLARHPEDDLVVPGQILLCQWCCMCVQIGRAADQHQALGVDAPRHHRDHQIFNSSTQLLEIVGLFGATPVPTFFPDGSALEVPWST